MRELTVKFIDKCAQAQIDCLIYCTLRSNAEQDELYSHGRTKPGPIVTNARAGYSSHNPGKEGKSKAFDCVPLLHGKPQWNDAATYLKMGEIAESVGLKWSGRFTGRLRETAHFSEDGR
jgi:peptidoglycan L-alanyl-D-glutamate endopeptidase CwlK